MSATKVTGQEAVSKLIDDAGLAGEWAMLDPAQLADLQSKFEETLAAIATNAQPQEHGETKTVVGGWSIRIGGTLWPLVIFVVKLGVAAHDPTGLSWKGTIASALNFLNDFAKVVHQLNSAEQLICAAIAQVCAGHRAAKVSPTGASRQEIVDALEKNGQQAPIKLDNALKFLVEKGVTAREDDASRGALYRVTF